MNKNKKEVRAQQIDNSIIKEINIAGIVLDLRSVPLQLTDTECAIASPVVTEST